MPRVLGGANVCDLFVSDAPGRIARRAGGSRYRHFVAAHGAAGGRGILSREDRSGDGMGGRGAGDCTGPCERDFVRAVAAARRAPSVTAGGNPRELSAAAATTPRLDGVGDLRGDDGSGGAVLYAAQP